MQPKSSPTRVLVIGAGPAGLTLGAALARRGYAVVAVDRDPGPAADGSWNRIGVGQFEHAHGFRTQVRELLEAEWPEAMDEWTALGAETHVAPLPGGAMMNVVRSRRITYERALRSAAQHVAGLTVTAGTATRLIEADRSVLGAVVDGRPVFADLVVDASGRSVQLAAARPAISAECGISYVGRVYRLHEDAEPGPLTTPVAWGADLGGYHAIVFPHEDRYLSAVIVRGVGDDALRDLRRPESFDVATQAIPGMRDWVSRDRSAPASRTVLGGRPRNVYRRQARLTGLVAVGDAVATTTPTAGRGVAMASMQIRALLDLLDSGADPRGVAEPFEQWCDESIRPWVEDHIARDDEAVRRLGGGDIDLSRPLTTTAIVDAAQAEPRIVRNLAGYLSMTALPSSLAPAEPLARAVYESGWRPPLAEGPTRQELAAMIAARPARPACNRLTPVGIGQLL